MSTIFTFYPPRVSSPGKKYFIMKPLHVGIVYMYIQYDMQIYAF